MIGMAPNDSASITSQSRRFHCPFIADWRQANTYGGVIRHSNILFFTSTLHAGAWAELPISKSLECAHKSLSNYKSVNLHNVEEMSDVNSWRPESCCYIRKVRREGKVRGKRGWNSGKHLAHIYLAVLQIQCFVAFRIDLNIFLVFAGLHIFCPSVLLIHLPCVPPLYLRLLSIPWAATWLPQAITSLLKHP